MEETLAFKVEIDGVEREIKSLKDLKQAKKDATDAFLRGDKDAAKALAELKDKTEDLTDATKSLKGEGVEKLSSSFGLLKEGFSSFDGEKIKTAFSGIGSAMKAIPLLLIVEGIRYLIENFDELSKGTGIVAKGLQFIGTIITGLKDAILNFADTLAGVNPELRAMSKEIDGLKDSISGLLSEQTGRLDRLIALSKANGEATVGYEKLKQEAIIKTNELYVKQIIAFVRAGGELTEAQKTQLSTSLENIKNAKTQEAVLEINHTKDLDAENKKRLENHKKLLADQQKATDEAWTLSLQIRASNREAQALDDKRLADEAKAQKQADDAAFIDEARLQTEQETENKAATLDATKQIRAQELEDFKTNYSAQLQIAQTTAQSLQSLSDLYFIVKSKNLQKGTDAERKAAEQQFKINKALAITSAIISGIQGVINALSAQSVIPEPFGTILKVASAVGIGIAAAANVAKIASTKFDAGGAAPSGGGSATTSVPIPSPPSLSAPTQPQSNGTTFDENGKKITEEQKQPTIQVKATVGVDEVSAKQNRVDSLEKQSTF